MAERGQVNADLMGAPGVEVTAQECMPACSLDHRIPRACEPPAADDGHPLALVWVSPNRPFELTRLLLHAPQHDGHVGAAERAVLELRRQRSVTHVIAGDG